MNRPLTKVTVPLQARGAVTFLRTFFALRVVFKPLPASNGQKETFKQRLL